MSAIFIIEYWVHLIIDQTLCVIKLRSNYSRHSVLTIFLSEYWVYLEIEVDLFEN